MKNNFWGQELPNTSSLPFEASLPDLLVNILYTFSVLRTFSLPESLLCCMSTRKPRAAEEGKKAGERKASNEYKWESGDETTLILKIIPVFCLLNLSSTN